MCSTSWEDKFKWLKKGSFTLASQLTVVISCGKLILEYKYHPRIKSQNWKFLWLYFEVPMMPYLVSITQKIRFAGLSHSEQNFSQNEKHFKVISTISFKWLVKKLNFDLDPALGPKWKKAVLGIFFGFKFGSCF